LLIAEIRAKTGKISGRAGVKVKRVSTGDPVEDAGAAWMLTPRVGEV